MSRVERLRLLPWPGPEGQPCYLSADDPASHVNRLADELETVQLDTGSVVLEQARDLLALPEAGTGELRWLSLRLCEALSDALRVAESRGGRLPDSGAGAEDEGTKR